MIPPSIPAAEILTVLLVELLFGLGYNRLAALLFRKGLLHASLAVVGGVLATLLIPLPFWWDIGAAWWQAMLLLTACFAASGTPMIIGSQWRTATSHKRRDLPNWVLHSHEDANRLISAALERLAQEMARYEQVPAWLLPLVNDLYEVKGILGRKQ